MRASNRMLNDLDFILLSSFIILKHLSQVGGAQRLPYKVSIPGCFQEVLNFQIIL